MAAIAHWDWPDNWPQLFDLLVNNLAGGNYSTIHGTLKVLKEIAEDLSDSQLPQIAPVILSHMYRIFSEDQVNSVIFITHLKPTSTSYFLFRNLNISITLYFSIFINLNKLNSSPPDLPILISSNEFHFNFYFIIFSSSNLPTANFF